MSTPLVPVQTPQIQPTPQQQAGALLQKLNTLLPSLQKNLQGPISYSLQLIDNPQLDEQVCEVSGKVVHIIATLAKKCEGDVGIRGDKGGLDWKTDLIADKDQAVDFFHREFVIHIPKEQMNDLFLFKLTLPGKNKEVAMWQTGKNIEIDLSQFGHFVNVELGGKVQFAEAKEPAKIVKSSKAKDVSESTETEGTTETEETEETDESADTQESEESTESEEIAKSKKAKTSKESKAAQSAKDSKAAKESKQIIAPKGTKESKPLVTSKGSKEVKVINNPVLDRKLCEKSGKIVHVIANLKTPFDGPMFIRGDKGGLDWESDRLADDQDVSDFSKREFTIEIPKEEMKDIFLFKLAVPGKAGEKPLWQTGKNNKVDLKKSGHITEFPLDNVQFAKAKASSKEAKK